MPMLLRPESKALEAFFTEPSEEKHGRRIERELGISHERAVSYLNALEKEKILVSREVGRTKLFRINKNNPLTVKVFGLMEVDRQLDFLRKNRKIAPILVGVREKLLESAREDICLILLFGSAARKHSRESSDLDILVVVDKNQKEVEKLCKSIKSLYHTKLEFHVVTTKDVESRWKREPVYATIWQDRIILYGEEELWHYVLKYGEPL
ncbi:MAG: nucleotidyltransferase domain-containing protein [Candidatus Diapherotrites archaeon]|nr:nucleotidyltransferase domain-containing protein [Candidatus Diapherotrites archaeon]